MSRLIRNEFLAIACEALGDEAKHVIITGVEPTPAGPRVRYEGTPKARPRGRRDLYTDRALAWEAVSRYLAVRWRSGPVPAQVPHDGFLDLMTLFNEVYDAPTETGPGWHWLLVMTAEWLREVGVPQGFASIQVKEKFGGLRFYWNSDEDDHPASGIIAAAEQISTGVCETCGAPGVLRKGSYLRTACDDHAN